MSFSPILNWISFESNLFSTLASIRPKDLIDAWKSPADRTNFYESFLMPNIASSMSFNIAYEWFRCDYAFLTNNGFPVVFIESENFSGTASKEIRNLCCLSAPVKVLITCCEWASTYSHGGMKKIFLPAWQKIISDHQSVYPTDAVYGIIVAECGNGLDTYFRFYSIGIDSSGKIFSEKVVKI